MSQEQLFNPDKNLDPIQREIRAQSSVLREAIINIHNNAQAGHIIYSCLQAIDALLAVVRDRKVGSLTELLMILNEYFRTLKDGIEIPREQIEVLFSVLAQLNKLADIKAKDVEEHVNACQATYQQLMQRLGDYIVQNKGSLSPMTKDNPTDESSREKNKPENEQVDIALITLFLNDLQVQVDHIDKDLINLRTDPRDRTNLENLIKLSQAIEQGGKVIRLEVIAQLGVALEECFHSFLQGWLWGKEEMRIFPDVADFLTHLAYTPPNKLESFIQKNKDRINNFTHQIHSTIFLKQTGSTPQALEPLIKAEEPEAFSLDPSMLDLFQIELENQSSVLTNGLIEWEQNPTDNKQLEVLMRAAHSIKGAARVVALIPIVKLSHAMEDCFVAAQHHQLDLDSGKVDRLLQAIDLFARLAELNIQQISDWLREQEPLIDAIVADILPFNKLKELSLNQAKIKTEQKVEAEKTEPEPKAETKPVEAQKGEQLALEVKLPKEAAKSSTGAATMTKAVVTDVTAKGDKRPDTMKAFQPSFSRDRILRVTAQNLNRLMGLAGESLVESRWLYPFSEALQQLKKEQNQLSGALDSLRENLREERINQRAEQGLQRLQTMVGECQTILSERLNELDNFIRRHASLSDRLYQEVINSRMRPFADGIEGFPRMVRDLARQLGKKVRLRIEGGATPIDRDILERLESPLSHLLRNAVDHGIEMPEERVAAGKSPEGTIKLEARHRAGALLITVSDDGRGIDTNQLRKSLVQKNIISSEMGNRLEDSELINYLFLSGFSTTEEVTEISGRGVGLNVVQTVVQEVGGVVKTFFTPGKGMSFHLQLPLTLSVIRALLVEISGEAYAFPLARIDQTFLLNLDQVERIENRQFFYYEGQNIGLIPAWQVLGMNQTKQALNMLPIVVVSSRSQAYGLVVDRLIGEKELVVQELDARLGKVHDISAGALMEDGNPVLIIDVDDIVHSIDELVSIGQLAKLSYRSEEEESSVSQRKRVLVVDDSITVREVECRLLQNQGYEVEAAVNGVDAWNAVRIGHYHLVITDIDMPRMDGIELVRLIKADPVLKQTPIMIVSYKEGEEDRIRGLEAGANYYLTKSSFHDATLLDAVRDLIGKP